MKNEISLENCHQKFIRRVEDLSGQNISLCYQCGKCSAACRLSQEMEAPPNKIIRYIQLGLKEQALSKNSIWLCTLCNACTFRCPQQLNLVEIIKSLRIISREKPAKCKCIISVYLKGFSRQIYSSFSNSFGRKANPMINNSYVPFPKIIEPVPKIIDKEE